MRGTNFSDYAFRLLMFFTSLGGRPIAIEETDEFYGISRGHSLRFPRRLGDAQMGLGRRGHHVRRPARVIGELHIDKLDSRHTARRLAGACL